MSPLKTTLFGLCVFLSIGCATPANNDVEPAEQPLHLYLLAGQSNMAGRGEIDSTRTHPRVFALKSDMSWGLASDPLHFDKPAIVGVGPGLAFGEAMADANAKIRIGLIPAAVGGSPIAAWTPGGVHAQTNTRPYDDALSRTFRVLAMHGGELKGIIWHQGESDRNDTAGYEDALVALVQRFRKEFGVSNLPFVAAELASYYTDKEPGALQINEAINQLPTRLPHVWVVTASGLSAKPDGVHLDAKSSRILGQRYAEAMIQLQAAALTDASAEQ